MCIYSVAGVEPQSELSGDKQISTIFRMCFVNKMDRTGAEPYRCVDMMKSRLGATPLVIQLPLGAESDFLGLIDLLEMKQLSGKMKVMLNLLLRKLMRHIG